MVLCDELIRGCGGGGWYLVPSWGDCVGLRVVGWGTACVLRGGWG